ncbi:YktB family protein [Heyndrickxia sp. NPDC080065]|uniref:YktB family protein n=1 Tax=Heyndrickxia sp. NPDC080065 TaxID=3390568 RepID=UPI003CFE6DE4
MKFKGFTNKDFDVFNIDGLDARMEQLINNIRPKLEDLGTHFAPTLSALTGEEMFPHVAKHARRTINPPNDTWVAFSSNNRGYKMLPHFQIGLWKTHLFIWFAVIYEAPNKADYGKNLERNINKILKTIPSNYVWAGDHTKPEAKEMNRNELLPLFQRLQTVKKAEILCGMHIPREQAIAMTGDELINTINDTFQHLVSLYNLA